MILGKKNTHLLLHSTNSKRRKWSAFFSWRRLFVIVFSQSRFIAEIIQAYGRGFQKSYVYNDFRYFKTSPNKENGNQYQNTINQNSKRLKQTLGYIWPLQVNCSSSKIIIIVIGSVASFFTDGTSALPKRWRRESSRFQPVWQQKAEVGLHSPVTCLAYTWRQWFSKIWAWLCSWFWNVHWVFKDFQDSVSVLVWTNVYCLVILQINLLETFNKARIV